jgi:type I restriction enzyme S subunit
MGSAGPNGWHNVARASGPGVTIGRSGVGSMGVVSFSTVAYWPHNTTLFVTDFLGNDPRFIYYFLKSLDFRRFDSGSAQASLNRNHLAAIPVRIPSDDVQRRIGGVLGWLDDKIELNRRMNQTLEEMERTLFRRWFVDSVRGEQVSLDHAASFLNGLALQKFPAADGAPFLPVLKIAQLREGNVKGADRASVDVPAAYHIKDGDLIFSWSGSLLVKIWTGGAAALNQHLFKVTSDTYPRWFLQGWLREHLPEFQAVAADKATTMGHIQRHHLTDAKIVVPDAATLERGQATIAPLEERMVQNDLESRTLAELRDLLVPKLLSGELRIGDAEHATQAIA